MGNGILARRRNRNRMACKNCGELLKQVQARIRDLEDTIQGIQNRKEDTELDHSTQEYIQQLRFELRDCQGQAQRLQIAKEYLERDD